MSVGTFVASMGASDVLLLYGRYQGITGEPVDTSAPIQSCVVGVTSNRNYFTVGPYCCSEVPLSSLTI